MSKEVGGAPNWPDPKTCNHKVKVTGSGVFCWHCGIEMAKTKSGYVPKLAKPSKA